MKIICVLTCRAAHYRLFLALLSSCILLSSPWFNVDDEIIGANHNIFQVSTNLTAFSSNSVTQSLYTSKAPGNPYSPEHELNIVSQLEEACTLKLSLNRMSKNYHKNQIN
jgi:hypothetical protein